MLTKNIVKHPKAMVEVQVAAPWADVDAKWSESLQKVASEAELPGFRKGQAPLPVIEQQMAAKVQEEFQKTVFPQLLIEALQGSDVVPIDYPQYQLVSFVKGQQVAFRAMVTQRPEVKISDYKAVKATKNTPKVITDEDVDKLVDDLFKRWQTRQPSAISSQPSDQNGAAGAMDFNQTPTSSASSTPDDNFAKAVGALSLADLKTKIKTDLENEAKYNNELDYEEAILQEVEKLTTVEVPEVLIQDELNRMLVGLQKRVADMGLLLEDYLKSQGKTLDQIKEDWRVQAEKNVRMELGLAEIARQEKVDITEAELQAEIDKIQDAKLKTQFEAQEPRLHLRHSLRQMKTLDLLKTLVNHS